MVTLPSMIIMFGLVYAFYSLNKTDFISKPIMLFGFSFSFIAGWLAWSFLIPKWRIFAFTKLDEKYHIQLKQEAIKAKLI